VGAERADVALNPSSGAGALGKSSIYKAIDSPPVYAKCVENFNDIYACKATIKLPKTITGGKPAEAYLRLTGYYHTQTTFKVTMKNGANTVLFNGVQPAVDSNGRANDMYRRVESRIQLTGNAVFPEFAVEVDNNNADGGVFCKKLTVTDQASATQDACSSYYNKN
jgi:hypothetical protein